MNEQTLKLIEQLAQKLGTTSEYLWSILLKQAPIEATTLLCQTVFVVIYGIFIWETHKYLSEKVNNGKYIETRYEEYEEKAVLPMAVAVFIFMICFIACFFCFGNIINGYFNPEYWALEKILNAAKH